MITIYGATNDRGDEMVKIEGAFRTLAGSQDDPLVEHVDGSDPFAIDATNHFVELVITSSTGEGLGVSLGMGDFGWCVAFEFVDGETALPWPVRLAARGPSPAVVVECPPQTTLAWIRTEKVSS